MVVVSDSSPLIGLFNIDLIDILPLLFSKITIPTSVREEIFGTSANPQKRLEPFSWIEVRQHNNQILRRQIQNENKTLHDGEVDSIVLAVELCASYLLIDERKGRIVAIKHNLRCIGLLSILLLAKEQNLISSVKDQINNLKAKNFRLSDELISITLKLANEC